MGDEEKITVPVDIMKDRIKEWMPFATPNPKLPVFWTPLSFFGLTFMSDRGVCQVYEIDYMRCAARVGMKTAETKCLKYLEDFQECQDHSKRAQRYFAIQKLRKKKKSFESPPPGDATQWERDRCY